MYTSFRTVFSISENIYICLLPNVSCSTDGPKKKIEYDLYIYIWWYSQKLNNLKFWIMITYYSICKIFRLEQCSEYHWVPYNIELLWEYGISCKRGEKIPFHKHRRTKYFSFVHLGQICFIIYKKILFFFFFGMLTYFPNLCNWRQLNITGKSKHCVAGAVETLINQSSESGAGQCV